MVDFLRVSEKFNTEEVTLKICSSSTSPVKTLIWQSKGEVGFNEEAGYSVIGKTHEKKAIGALEIAKKKNVDLLLTPEYSIPISIIDKIINSSEFWPGPHSLWVICSEGISVKNFSMHLKQWRKKLFYTYVADYFTGNFLCPMFYFFTDDSGEKLNLFIQFKTQHMGGDKRLKFESGNLSEGKQLFIFDLNGQKKCKNLFLSFICADVLKINLPEKIKGFDEFLDYYYVVFNPQLNLNPRHKEFLDFRKGFFRFLGEKGRLITLNWGEKTALPDRKAISDPWSAFYILKNNDLHNQSFLDHIYENHNTGSFFARDEYIDIWHWPSEESLVLFNFKKGFKEPGISPAITYEDFVGKGLISYNEPEEKWESTTSSKIQTKITKELKDLIRIDEDGYNFYLDASPRDCDRFFGLCFGCFEEQFCCEGEVCKRVLIGNYSTSRLEQIADFRELVSQLKKGNIPEFLTCGNENHDIQKRHKLMVKEYSQEEYSNLFPWDEQYCHCCGLVIITSSKDYNNVEKEFFKIYDKIPNHYKEKIVFYFRLGGETDYSVFSDHKSNLVTSKQRNLNIASIKPKHGRRGNSDKNKE